MSLLRAVTSSFTLTFRLRVANPRTYGAVLVQTLVFAVIGLVLLSGGGSHRTAYALIGGGLSGVWSMLYLGAGGDMLFERLMGTLDQVLGAPTPFMAVVAGKVGSSLALGVIGFATMLGGGWFLHVLPPIDPGPFAVSLALTLAGFFSLTLVLAPLFALSRWALSIANGLEVSLFAVCGLMFPTALLPAWLQTVSWLVAPTWTVRGMYAAAGQPVGRDYARWWLAACALCLANLLLAALVMRIADRRMRVTGQLINP